MQTEVPTTMQAPSIGRIVHYHAAPFDDFEGDRPAIIVRVWDEEPTGNSRVQLQVFLDGNNDKSGTGLVWKTSVAQGEEAGSFSFPRIPGRA